MIILKSEHPKLNGIIDYYYFHKIEQKEQTLQYSFFPNYKNAITAYLGSTVQFAHSKSNVQPTDADVLSILYTTNYYGKIDVSIHGPFQKIGIVFHPIGINHFLKQSLHEIHSGETSHFNALGEVFEETLRGVFAQSNQKQRVYLLDQFFSERLNPVDTKLTSAVHLIFQSKGDIRVHELAEIQKCNRNTLLRLFKKHLTCSIEEYRKLIKFRLAFDEMQRQSKIPLTQLALENNYYDQADFIRQFKSLAHDLPSKLKQQLTSLGPNGPFWRIQE